MQLVQWRLEPDEPAKQIENGRFLSSASIMFRSECACTPFFVDDIGLARGLSKNEDREGVAKSVQCSFHALRNEHI